MKLSTIEPFAARPAIENDHDEGSNPIKELIVPNVVTKVQTSVETQPDLNDQKRSPQSCVIYLDFIRRMRSQKAKFRQSQWATKKISIYNEVQTGVYPIELIGTRLNKIC